MKWQKNTHSSKIGKHQSLPYSESFSAATAHHFPSLAGAVLVHNLLDRKQERLKGPKKSLGTQKSETNSCPQGSLLSRGKSPINSYFFSIIE